MDGFAMDLVFMMLIGIFTTITCAMVLAFMIGYFVGRNRGKEVARYEQDRN